MHSADKILLRRHGPVVEAVLNSEATLNALDHAMADRLYRLLPTWADDDSVHCVVLRGAGERAFCAGGDIQNLYTSMQSGNYAACDAFFDIEYRLDYALHAFPKPLIAWVNGFVMGGGMGLMQGCDFRVVTPQVRMAMPETHIGFLPDVGAGYFLNRRADGLQWALALCGAQIGGDDAVFLQLADFQLAADQYDGMLAFLSSPADADAGAIARWLSSAHSMTGDGWLALRQQALTDAMGADSCTAALAALSRLSDCHPRAGKFFRRLDYASPLALELTWAHLQRSRGQGIAEVLSCEYDLVCKLSRHGEFAEGVRALIVDRDNRPDWARVPDSLAPWFERDTCFNPARATAGIQE